MAYANTRELKDDVLWRASESRTAGVSDWELKVIDYLNRNYRELCIGASAFLPEYVDDWWWMRTGNAFLIEPVYQIGTIQVTNGSNSMLLSTPSAIDLVNRKIRITSTGDPTVYGISTHGAGNSFLFTDTVYLGTTANAAKYQAMKVV